MNRNILETHYKNYKVLGLLSQQIEKSKHFETKFFFKRLVLNDKTREFIINYPEFKDLRLENDCLIFGDDSLLTNKALFDLCLNKFFAKQINYFCDNDACINNKGVGSDNILLKCPMCKAKFSLSNVKNLEQLDFNIIFFLCNYDFFYIEDYEKTTYLIFDKITENYFIKQGNSNIKDWLYTRLKYDFINRYSLNWKFINYYGLNKSFENALFDFFKQIIICKFINDLDFKPCKKLIFHDENKNFFNIYKGNKYLNMEKKKLRKDFNLKKNCPNILELCNNLTNNDTKALEYLFAVLSFQLQNPNIRIGKVMIFFGDEQSGKGTFYKQIYQKLFKGYCSIQNQKVLDEPFNNYLSNQLGVFFDETRYKKEHEDLLKNWATEDEIYINTKFGKNGSQKAYFLMFAFSNNDLPLKVGERRGIYFRCKTLGGNKLLSSKIGVRLNESIPKEIDKFADYLWSLNYDFEFINNGYSSQAKLDIIDATKSIEDEFLEELFSFETLDGFAKNYNSNSRELLFNNFIKEEWIEANFFLQCYNSFRFSKNKKYSNISLKSFNWFFLKLDIDKNNLNIYKRSYNTNKQNVFWINIKSLKNIREINL